MVFTFLKNKFGYVRVQNCKTFFNADHMYILNEN
jgi:hypothetical protein